MDWKEVLLSGFLPVIKGVASAQVKELVDKLDVQEGDEDFKNDLKGFNNLLKRLQSAALKSKTPWDDLAVSVFVDPINQKAAELGIVLD